MSLSETSFSERAKEVALTYLAYQDRTEWQVRNKLDQKGFTGDVIDAVIVRLRRVNLLNDHEYARRFVETRIEDRPMGEMRLTHDLLKRGIPRDVIDDVLSEFGNGIGSEQSALTVLRQYSYRYRGLAPEKTKQRMFGLLSRRGFDADTARRAVENILNETLSVLTEPDTKAGR